MLRSVRIRSLKDTSLRLGTPVFLVLMGLVVCLLWGVWENRKLADKYIADTAKLYVDQINRDMSQINSELIYLLDSDSNIKEIPDQITSTDAQYYEMEQTLRERNRVLKIRYHEIQTFFVYGQKANVLITDSGTMFTESKGMTTLNQMLMSADYDIQGFDQHTMDRDYVWRRRLYCRLVREKQKSYRLRHQSESDFPDHPRQNRGV